LKRLGYESRVTETLDYDVMLPAVGQGALAILCRRRDETTRRVLQVLDHAPTRTAVVAERGLLRALGGSCQVPIAGQATIAGDRLTIRGLIASLDGTRVIKDELAGPPDRAPELGIALGQKLLDMGAGEILSEIARYGAGL
jgi:hydroxymethylbilane synthase